MKITKVETIKLRCPTAPGLADALCAIAFRDVLLVIIETDEGIRGIGEGFALGCLNSVAEAVNESIVPLIMGRDPMMIEKILKDVYTETYRYGRRGIFAGAVSAVDIALWDIRAKAADMPLYKMLGGHKSKVRAYASAGYYAHGKTPQDLSDEAASYLDMGFSFMKMKIGGLSMEEDIERISALRRRVGNKLSLAVDANCMYDLRGAIKMARLMEPYDISFFEEPMAGESIEDVIRLREMSAIPIAGFETELSRFAMRDFIASRAVDIAQLDAIWSGGVSECMKIAAMADCYGMEIIPHFSAGAVSFAANLHVAAALANCPIIEYTLDPNPLRDDLATEKPLRTGEYVKLNDKPGLGVELDFDIVNRYRVK